MDATRLKWRESEVGFSRAREEFRVFSSNFSASTTALDPETATCEIADVDSCLAASGLCCGPPRQQVDVISTYPGRA